MEWQPDERLWFAIGLSRLIAFPLPQGVIVTANNFESIYLELMTGSLFSYTTWTAMWIGDHAPPCD